MFDGWKLNFLYRKIVGLKHQRKKFKMVLPIPSPKKDVLKKRAVKKKQMRTDKEITT